MRFRKFVKSFIPRSLFLKVEPFGHLCEAMVMNLIHGFPARGMKVIGVTGTDGKTTTSMLIAQMLRHNDYKVGLLTTAVVDLGDGKGEVESPTHLTTASSGSLLKMIKKMKANGVEWLVLETSSHALHQNRVWGIPYSVAVFTNLSHEHLDYHKTIENYRDAKRKLFRLCNKNKQGLMTGIINSDDEYSDYFEADINNPITYGLKSGQLRATKVHLTANGSRFVVKTENHEYRLQTHLAGKFNIYNCLAALGVGRALGLHKEQIEKGIESLSTVPGRMMLVSPDSPFSVYIDYAVTPIALKNVLLACRELAKDNKVSIVFGATGDRDKDKRPIMGEVVAKFADRIYLTDDETYTEDAKSIRDAVFAGVKTAGGSDKCQIFDDRAQAIKSALDEANVGDVVVITGLGHQTTRNMDGEYVDWSDEQVVAEILAT